VAPGVGSGDLRARVWAKGATIVSNLRIVSYKIQVNFFFFFLFQAMDVVV
jgi:hypothetical protein